MSYPDYAERTFFWRVTGDEVPITEFSKFFNKNSTKYLSNMYLLYGKLWIKYFIGYIKINSKNIPVLSLWNPPNPLKKKNRKFHKIRTSFNKKFINILFTRTLFSSIAKYLRQLKGYRNFSKKSTYKICFFLRNMCGWYKIYNRYIIL